MPRDTLDEEECRHVAGVIKTKRRDLRLSQAALAKLIGVTSQQVQKYERGMSSPTVGRLRAICRSLAISANTLIGTEEN